MSSTLIIIVAAVCALGAATWAIIKWRNASRKELKQLIKAIGVDSITDVIIPDGAGGEIHIDHLLLTPHGLMLLDTKDIQGAVFAGERMDTWSATHEGKRLTFENPIPTLEQRAAAVGLLAPTAPIEAKVLFTEDATFPKGHPSTVATVAQLLEAYKEFDLNSDPQDYTEEWERIRGQSSVPE